MRALYIASLFGLVSAGCSGASDPTPAPAQQGIAVVRGPMSDPASAKAAHDGIVSHIKSMLNASGDRAHTVFVGVQDPTAFLAVDRWDDLAAAKATYASAEFQTNFAAVIAGPPSIEYYLVAPGFSTYGTLDASVNGLPSFALVVEGTLQEADTTKSSAAQNAIVDNGKAAAMALGDVAHVPFVGEDTTQAYFNIDIWMDPANAQKFFTDPQVAAAFGGLFSAPPDVTPYAATDWMQW
jgi:quinol monooxygenase YgiN